MNLKQYKRNKLEFIKKTRGKQNLFKNKNKTQLKRKIKEKNKRN